MIKIGVTKIEEKKKRQKEEEASFYICFDLAMQN
jgi:hypothetical protein